MTTLIADTMRTFAALAASPVTVNNNLPWSPSIFHHALRKTDEGAALLAEWAEKPAGHADKIRVMLADMEPFNSETPVIVFESIADRNRFQRAHQNSTVPLGDLAVALTESVDIASLPLEDYAAVQHKPSTKLPSELFLQNYNTPVFESMMSSAKVAQSTGEAVQLICESAGVDTNTPDEDTSAGVAAPTAGGSEEGAPTDSAELPDSAEPEQQSADDETTLEDGTVVKTEVLLKTFGGFMQTLANRISGKGSQEDPTEDPGQEPEDTEQLAESVTIEGLLVAEASFGDGVSAETKRGIRDNIGNRLDSVRVALQELDSLYLPAAERAFEGPARSAIKKVMKLFGKLGAGIQELETAMEVMDSDVEKSEAEQEESPDAEMEQAAASEPEAAEEEAMPPEDAEAVGEGATVDVDEISATVRLVSDPKFVALLESAENKRAAYDTIRSATTGDFNDDSIVKIFESIQVYLPLLKRKSVTIDTGTLKALQEAAESNEVVGTFHSKLLVDPTVVNVQEALDVCRILAESDSMAHKVVAANLQEQLDADSKD